MINNIRVKRLALAIVAFGLPALTFGIMMFFYKITPFGDNTIAYFDSINQYTSFFAYFKQNLGNSSAFLYNTSNTIGGNFFGIYTYYLLNPLNYLIIFFPLEKIPRFILVLTWLKVSFAGLSMYVYLRIHFRLKLFKQINGRSTVVTDLIFSTAYAMSAFSIEYMNNVMWLDAVIFLPIIILGLERIFNGFRPYLFAISLLYTLLVNYYMGYIVGFFVAFYFVFLIIYSRVHRFQTQMIRIRALRAFGYGIISLGLSMVILLPSFASTMGGDKTPYKFTWNLQFNWIDTIYTFLNGIPGSKAAYAGPAPAYFSGSLVVILLLLFFMNNNIDFSDKLLWGGLLGILIFMGSVNGLYLAWHAFTIPNGYPHRESVCVIFVMVLMAATEVRYKLAVTKGSISKLLMALVGILLIFTKFDTYITGWVIVYNIAIFGLFIFLINKMKLSYKYQLLFMLLALGDIGYGVYNNWQFNVSTLKSSAYSNFITQTTQPINYIKQSDKGFYRIGTSFEQSPNQPLLLNYNGLSVYSGSPENSNLTHFLSGIGYFQNYGTRWSNFDNGATTAINEMLGVKYYVVNENQSVRDGFANMRSDIGFDNVVPFSPVGKRVAKINGFNIYKDKNALPLANVVSDKILSNGMQFTQSSNPFKIQNEVWRTVENVKQKLNTAASVKQRMQTNVMKASIRPRRNGRLYIFIQNGDGSSLPHVVVKEHDRLLSNYGYLNQNGIVDLGYRKKGHVYSIQMVEKDNPKNLAFKPDILAYSQSAKAIKDMQQRLRNNGPVTSKFVTNRNLILNFQKRSSSTVMLSLPYESGWHAENDKGRAIKIRKGLGSLMALKIPAGSHRVMLSFYPAGLKLGIIASAVTILLAIVIVVWTENHQKRLHGL